MKKNSNYNLTQLKSNEFNQRNFRNLQKQIKNNFQKISFEKNINFKLKVFSDSYFNKSISKSALTNLIGELEVIKFIIGLELYFEQRLITFFSLDEYFFTMQAHQLYLKLSNFSRLYTEQESELLEHLEVENFNEVANLVSTEFNTNTINS